MEDIRKFEQGQPSIIDDMLKPFRTWDEPRPVHVRTPEEHDAQQALRAKRKRQRQARRRNR